MIGPGVKQGQAYDSEIGVYPHILAFISTYAIPIDELLIEDLHAYKTFNSFFSRALKPSARPPAFPEDSQVVSSAADCRLVTFSDVSSAGLYWIKGYPFSLAEMFQDEQLAAEFEGGAVAVFRLAPADYHRWHSATDGTIGATKTIEGQCEAWFLRAFPPLAADLVQALTLRFCPASCRLHRTQTDLLPLCF